ncbi:hypothetical protein F5884DRAFT_755205 [Xylogone sp. PMI_703]|nr:hypothetical protein F5884DRAFT_755205 [Xylogone sp. PMI_703]
MAKLKPSLSTHHSSIQALRALTPVRDATVRKGRTLYTGRKSNMEAYLAHLGGQVNSPACENCTRSRGLWHECVFAEGHLKGACTNCHYNNQGSRCSFRLNKARAGHSVPPAVRTPTLVDILNVDSSKSPAAPVSTRGDGRRDDMRARRAKKNLGKTKNYGRASSVGLSGGSASEHSLRSPSTMSEATLTQHFTRPRIETTHKEQNRRLASLFRQIADVLEWDIVEKVEEEENDLNAFATKAWSNSRFTTGFKEY